MDAPKLFGLGTDSATHVSNVYHIWWTAGSNGTCSSNPETWAAGWAGLKSGVPTGGFDPHLMASNTNDGRLQIFAVAVNSPSDIWTNWQNGIGGGWTSWGDFGSGTSGMVFYPGQP